MKQIILGLSCALLLGCNESKRPVGENKVTANKPVMEDRSQLDRDNTGVNTRDRDRATKTPIDQNENKQDMKLTAAIRKQVLDKKMSVDAQNAKIITQDGHVTLRGPVKSEE